MTCKDDTLLAYRAGWKIIREVLLAAEDGRFVVYPPGLGPPPRRSNESPELRFGIDDLDSHARDVRDGFRKLRMRDSAVHENSNCIWQVADGVWIDGADTLEFHILHGIEVDWKSAEAAHEAAVEFIALQFDEALDKDFVVYSSRCFSPKELRTMFGIDSQTTMREKLATQTIRNRKISTKKYQIDLSQLPKNLKNSG